MTFMKEINQGFHVIVDVSSAYFSVRRLEDTHSCAKRPSGIIIKERGEDCEIIWVENNEVSVDEFWNDIYPELVTSKLAIDTLLLNLKREQSKVLDAKINLDSNVGAYLLLETRLMKNFFMDCVFEAPETVDELHVSLQTHDPIRILFAERRKDLDVWVGIKSVKIEAKPLSVFKFLLKKDLGLQFVCDVKSEADENPEQLFKFVSEDESNTITLHRKKIGEEYKYCLEEATRDDSCSFIISKVMDEDAVGHQIVARHSSVEDQFEDDFHDDIVCFQPPDRKKKIPSLIEQYMTRNDIQGFSIMPTGGGGLHCNGSIITFLLQLKYDLEVHPTIGALVRDFFEAMKNIIRELIEEEVSSNSFLACILQLEKMTESEIIMGGKYIEG
ncbi:hypothetical protein PTKIN_Ptkin15bG0125200 [Pterospermum kingtungense]